MLVLTRKKEEAIRIGKDIVVKIIDIDGRQIKLGIEAPKQVSVYRQEVYDRILAENRAATNSETSAVSLAQVAGLLKQR